MKKTLLTGVAALLLVTGAAHAAEKASTLPPPEFDKPFTGELEIVRLPNMQEVEATCKWPGKKAACTHRQMKWPRLSEQIFRIDK
jgi:hypothetical protein